jgi:hypothetical protein
MELTITKGFEELSADEQVDVNGGNPFVFLGVALALVLIAGCVKGCTDEAAK